MTTDAAYYDRTMTGKHEPAMLELADSPWLALYQEASSWIPRNHDVVDLGCGTGRFLSLLAYQHRGNGVEPAPTLTGIDFSAAALAEAAEYARETMFECEDLRDWQPSPTRSGSTTYTCLEVLEHLDDDLDLVGDIPPGHQFVFSVPNYESESHQRWFRTAGAVWDRYDRLLTFRRWALIPMDDRKAIHAIDAVRRQDSW